VTASYRSIFSTPRQATGAQEAAIANKQDFTPEEWTRLLESPMLVGIAVSAADPSGLWGTLKEAAACSSALSGANGESSANELVQAVRTEFENSDGRANAQKALRGRFAAAEPSDCVARCSPACAKSRSSSMPKRPATQPHSRLG
jgi:hypothetical protein